MQLSEQALEDQILTAHGTGDTRLLAELYARAAESVSDHDQTCFLSTQAYVYALQSNHPLKSKLHAFLRLHGREE
jgi:hypothetical protein